MMETVDADKRWLRALPKIELHVHLEGAIPLPALWQLVEKYDGSQEVPSLEALESRFRYRDFGQFLSTWSWKNGFLREAEDFTFAAEAVARDLAAQNVLYAEAFYSPPDFLRHGLEIGEITEAVRAGLDRVAELRIGLVADLVRDFGPDAGMQTLDALAEVRGYGVVGIGIGGTERSFPPEPFAPVFERARALGFRTSAHAGEAAGPSSVWGAINVLHVDRIGHGTRAVEDPKLLAHLARSRVPIEMCPMSNVRTGVVPSLAAHPIRTLMGCGALVTVNTDDPAMFQTSLEEEFAALMAVHGLDRSEVAGLIHNALSASWLDGDERAKLRARLAARSD